MGTRDPTFVSQCHSDAYRTCSREAQREAHKTGPHLGDAGDVRVALWDVWRGGGGRGGISWQGGGCMWLWQQLKVVVLCL